MLLQDLSGFEVGSRYSTAGETSPYTGAAAAAGAGAGAQAAHKAAVKSKAAPITETEAVAGSPRIAAAGTRLASAQLPGAITVS